MYVTATFDAISPEYEIEVPEGQSAEDAVWEWLEDNLEEVADAIRCGEIWPRSIEEE